MKFGLAISVNGLSYVLAQKSITAIEEVPKGVQLEGKGIAKANIKGKDCFLYDWLHALGHERFVSVDHKCCAVLVESEFGQIGLLCPELGAIVEIPTNLEASFKFEGKIDRFGLKFFNKDKLYALVNIELILDEFGKEIKEQATTETEN